LITLIIKFKTETEMHLQLEFFVQQIKQLTLITFITKFKTETEMHLQLEFFVQQITVTVDPYSTCLGSSGANPSLENCPQMLLSSKLPLLSSRLTVTFQLYSITIIL